MSKQIELSFPAPGLVRATFNNPPINLVDPDTIFELSDLIEKLETDPEIKVIVFESGDSDFRHAARFSLQPGTDRIEVDKI